MKGNEENCYDILILYGSQTGTAKFAAEEFQRELYKFYFTSKISEMDAYNFLSLPEEIFIIFLISTTGYGEFPSNSKSFWNFLVRKDLPEDSLENVNYTVFGLGDSSYEKFNQCAKLLNSRLHQLSANLFHPVALGDDQHDFGYEAEFDPWVKSVIEELYCYFPEKFQFRDQNRSVFDFFMNKVDFEVKIFDKNCIGKEGFNVIEEIFHSFYFENYNALKHCEDNLFKIIESNKIAFIKKNEIVTSEDSFKKVFNVKLEIKEKENLWNDNHPKNEQNKKNYDITGPFNFLMSKNELINSVNTEIFYNFADEKIKNYTRNLNVELKDNTDLSVKNHSLLPGDSALLFPINDNETVSKFMKILNIKDDDYLIFKYKNNPFNSGVVFPFIINGQEFVKKWLNINGFPNRFFCYIASLFTEESIYKEKLELFASKSSVTYINFMRYLSILFL